MIRLSDVVETFEADFLARYGCRLSVDQRRALAALRDCRRPGAAQFVVRCRDCGHVQRLPHSCGHRHCPHCQHHESQRWIERQRQHQVPATWFLLTFTLPAEFRPLAFAHPATVYDLLMRCAWQTVETFARHDRQLAGTPGAIAVLHTQSRRLDYHPHVHLVMPAAAVDGQRRRWRTRRHGRGKPLYLFSHAALAKVFRAKVLAGLAAAGIALPHRHPPAWVVDCKAVGDGDKAFVYLGRYLYRGVIREQDILACGDGEVTFRYRNAKSGKLERRTLAGADFLWLVLQHVLPKGFRRARNFGFLHPNCKRLIALLQVLLRAIWRVAPTMPRPAFRCPCCDAAMMVVRTRVRPAGTAPPAAAPALAATM
jgi:Putative transposase/Transposase zinc-binding domain